MMNSSDTNRLKWKCRRGLLELDLVLEKYVKANPQDETLSELLELPDNDLWDIVCGRSDQYAFHLRETVARLRAA
jgi:succinate dehydrogenase flavin-adding protein (antitoxin of CptAB toxin-antitoxin module)